MNQSQGMACWNEILCNSLLERLHNSIPKITSYLDFQWQSCANSVLHIHQHLIDYKIVSKTLMEASGMNPKSCAGEKQQPTNNQLLF